MSNTRLEGEFRSYWNCWLDNEESEANLRLYSMPIVEEFRRAVQDLNWTKAARLQECYSFIARNCEHEPLLSAYELGQMHILLVMADYHALAGNWNEARANLVEVETALRIGDERREQLGMSPRGNSEIRMDCLAIRATVLIGEDNPEDSAQQAPALAKEFELVADKIIAGVRNFKRDDEQHVEAMLQTVTASELEVVKLCWLVDRELAKTAITRFNERVGPHLEFMAHHYKELPAAEQRSAWYWDLEVFKLMHTEADNIVDIRACARERKLSARLTFGAGPLRAFELKWARELRRYRK